MNSKLSVAYYNLETIVGIDVPSGIKNVESWIVERKIVFDHYWEHSFLPIIIAEKINFTIEDLKNKLIKSFQPAQPTKALAEHYSLEKWLDQRLNTNEELRFTRYKEFLRESGNGANINQLESETYKILDSCHDPRILNREWDRRGLVYGHVQSGKTQNYLGLVNRAFDAGYQIIIILTGVTEDLRKQTQERVDKGVLEISNYLHAQGRVDKIWSPTNIAEDLNINTYHNLITNYDLHNKSIWVIKKNKTVLEILIFWLNHLRKLKRSEKVNNTPFLIIDDEGDNASIQSMTKNEFEEWESEIKSNNLNLEEENDENNARTYDFILKTINKYIRIILSLISNKTFISYTATPYSIINQTYEDIDRGDQKIKDEIFKIDAGDLFPEHFIIPIKPGSYYFGIDKIFNSNSGSNIPCIININNIYPQEEINTIFTTNKNEQYTFNVIPESLMDAILYFLVSIVIKKYRKIKYHNTMLIHTSHLTSKTDYLAVKVKSYIEYVYNELRRHDSNLFKKIEVIFQKIKNESQNPLYNKYFELNNEFPDKIYISDIADIYSDLEQKIEVVSYHSSNDQNLKFQNRTLSYKIIDQFSQLPVFRNYIVIGGNRLSRGLTFEGLTTSYFIRTSTRQDSLYQMGRWFGYRKGYEDLVRIFIPEDQLNWFQSIYKLETQLRKDFEENNDDDSPILPRNAIIKLANFTSEKYLTGQEMKKFPSICDPNKLRKTTTQKMSFSGPISTNKIFSDQDHLSNNIYNVIDLFEKLYIDYSENIFDYTSLPKGWNNSANISFTNIPPIEVINFLKYQKFHPDILQEMKSFIKYLFMNTDKSKNWSICLVNRKTNKEFEEIKWDIKKFYKKTNSNISKIRPVIRTPQILDDNKTWKYSSILEGRAEDTVFDLMNLENVEMFNEKPHEKMRLLRDKMKIPLLLIYPVFSPDQKSIFPLIYIFSPKINNSTDVNYIVRKNYRQS